MTVYVNISNTFNTQAKTGIQRVVREVISRLVKKDIVLIVWFKAAFYQLECQEVTSLLAGDSFEPVNNYLRDRGLFWLRCIMMPYPFYFHNFLTPIPFFLLLIILVPPYNIVITGYAYLKQSTLIF